MPAGVPILARRENDGRNVNSRPSAMVARVKPLSTSNAATQPYGPTGAGVNTTAPLLAADMLHVAASA